MLKDYGEEGGISINYNKFFQLANELILNKTIEEVKIRTSISRAYVYAFHYVRENYRNHPDSNFKNGTGDHDEAIQFLKRLKEGRLASTLLSLTARRNNAEYDLPLDYKRKQKAEDYIDDVKDFIQKMECEKTTLKKRRV